MFHPLNDRLIVKRLQEPGKPIDGKKQIVPGAVEIITPESALQASQYGQILAVGPGRLLDNGERAPIYLYPGQRIWFGRYNDYDFEKHLTGALAGEKLIVVMEADVVAVDQADDPSASARFVPVLNHLLIRRDDTKTTQGLIVLPDTAQEPRYTGTVVAAGPGKYAQHNGQFYETCVKAGDRVLWGENLGREVWLDGNELYLLRDTDLFAVLDPNEEVEPVPGDPNAVVTYECTA